MTASGAGQFIDDPSMQAAITARELVAAWQAEDVDGYRACASRLACMDGATQGAVLRALVVLGAAACGHIDAMSGAHLGTAVAVIGQVLDVASLEHSTGISTEREL